MSLCCDGVRLGAADDGSGLLRNSSNFSSLCLLLGFLGTGLNCPVSDMGVECFTTLTPGDVLGLGAAAELLEYEVGLPPGNSGFCSADAAVWSTLVRKSSARPAMSLNQDMSSVGFV